MTIEEMKNDANWPDFAKTPEAVTQYALREADRSIKYVSWLYFIGGEAYQRTWAFKRTKARGFEITEVERKGTPEEYAIQKNIYWAGMAGWQVVFSKPAEDIPSPGVCYYYWQSDFDTWHTEKPIGTVKEILNFSELYENETFKFCGYSSKEPLISYLREWKKNPQVEYFGKLGIMSSALLMNKCKKDRQFIKFLQTNAGQCSAYGPRATVYAYDHGMTIHDANWHLWRIREANRRLARLRDKKKIKPDVLKLIKYLDENKIPVSNYADYWEALVELGFDMSDTKNIYPKDFQRMHDLRVDEYAALKDRRDKAKRRKLYADFKKESQRWQRYERKGDQFEIVIAPTVQSLRKEGRSLHHCVGKMGYEKKMAEGRCIIAFLRKTEEPEKPFVTIEFIPKDRRISQIYGDHDSKPEQEVLDFAKEWEKVLAKALKRKAAGAV